jgi:very-short-patch-repair endonuclease
LDKAYDRTPTLRSRELRNNPTPAEKRLWLALSNRRLGARFNRQVVIRPFICDFVARTAKLIIELDGGQHALNADADAKRTRFLESRGYRVLRFWNNEVLENVEGVVTAIERALADRPSPNPSREREGNPYEKGPAAICGGAWTVGLRN